MKRTGILQWERVTGDKYFPLARFLRLTQFGRVLKAEIDSKQIRKEQLEEVENGDDGGDPQARAMGLEKWEDDPHTPIPPYVTALRIDAFPGHNTSLYSSSLGDKLE